MASSIKKISWQSISEKIESLNSKLFNLINPISNELKKSNQNYVYQLEVPYGEQLLKNGKALILIQNKQDNYSLENNFNSDSFSWNDFYKDCNETTDHPFAIVIQNCVEIYGENKSAESNCDDYPYPISIINEGECFGIWGIMDILTKINVNNIAGWHGAAGRVCFVPLLKKVERNKSAAQYRLRILNFLPNADNKDIGFRNNLIDYFKKCEINKPKETHLIVIPENYIFIRESDSKSLRNCKIILHYHLLKLAWQSVEGYRNLWWHFKEINETNSETKNDLFKTSILHHLKEVKGGKSFGLRPVHNDDGIIYDFQLELIKSFKKYDILNIYFPGILIYSKVPKTKYLCVSLNSPAFTSFFNQTRRAELRKKIESIEVKERENLFKDIHFYNPNPSSNTKFLNSNKIVEEYLKETFLDLVQKAIGTKFEKIKIYLPENINFAALIDL